jgi:prevent-host-death family protein
MATTALRDFLGMFGDQVYSSTDLNRRAGEVLDQARNGPVTISRNKEQFALLRREQAAKLVETALQFGPTIELVEGALCVVEGKEPSVTLAWLKAYDVDDLRKMIREVLVASITALRETCDWDNVNAVIHEWHESALVAMSGVFDETMNSTSERTPLTDPRTILEAEKELAPKG